MQRETVRQRQINKQRQTDMQIVIDRNRNIYMQSVS